MKKYILSSLLCILTCNVLAQDDITLFFLNDGSFKGFYDEEIDSITYSHLDLDSIWHSDAVVQEVWVGDSVVRIPVEDIDSICHKIPDPVYKPGVIRIDGRYLPYILSVDGMTITFSSDLPGDLRPHQDDVLLYEGCNDLFPDGFAGKVVSLDGDKVICEQADIPDIYEKFVFFGRYALVDKNEEAENTPAYSLRRVKRRSSGDEDYGIDNWRMGDGSISDIGIGTITIPVKFKFKKIHTTVMLEYKVTPTISIEYAYDGYWKNIMFFWKTNVANDYEIKVGASVSVEDKLEDPTSKLAKVSPWEPGTEPNFKEINLADYSSEGKDDKDSESVYLIDKEVPIPEFPLIKVGFKLGFFMEPKAKADISFGMKKKGHFDKIFIYRYDKDHDGDTQYYSSKPTCETEYYLDVSGKLSLWLGLVGAIVPTIGVGKQLEAKEETKVKVGPYFEGELKANIIDAIADKSWYSLLKDSKLKTGVKLGIDCSFKANFFGKKANWKFLSWSPKNLFWEKTAYIFPKFEAPEYSVSGNTLTCTTKVSRATMPNTIGFSLYDENGNVVRKFQKEEYYYSEKDHPLTICETFNNLDFANHRYTIVPTTRPMGKEFFQVDMPDDFCTTVLCPNSHHPHLIDLGLPSGTKWLCRNLYADNPQDDGGYYQWGKSAMVHSYNNITYRSPNIPTSNYQGSEYDAATANLDLPYVTPTLSQFDELFDNCSYDIRYSTWGETIFGSAEGVYLKGRNGNNLYLPFSGLKSGTTVAGDSEETGYFLTSDVFSGDGHKYGKVTLVNKDGRGSTEALGYGYSLRPVSSESSGLTFEPQEIDFEEVLIASQNLGTVSKSFRATNTGTAPVTMKVSQTVAPFTVHSESEGTHTLQPKESKDIYVSFVPTAIAEYNSELNIQYDTDNSCTVSKIPLHGKGIGNGFILSSNAVSLTEGCQTTIDITSGNGSYSVEDSHPSVATATVSGATITIYAITVGIDTITVTDNLSDQKAEIVVTVTAKPDNPELTPGEAIDLGLPSGTKWASCNVGATKPEEYGGYYAWGETEEKDVYNYYSYTVRSDIGSIKKINGSGYDVAHVKWGEVWMMPTEIQFRELLNCCTTEWTQLNGVNGYKFTGPNNNCIFLPAGGERFSDRLNGEGKCGCYWSGFSSSRLFFEDSYTSLDGSSSYEGLLVRPVMNVRIKDVSSCPDDNHPHYIDLGLPNGTLWSCSNIDASSPVNYGNYYAWGETEEKDIYDWNSYIHCDGSCETCHDIGNNISSTQYDIAYSKWGGSWEMPTITQFVEIINNCSIVSTQPNGVEGMKFTGPNGNSIFLPAAGYYYNEVFRGEDEECRYWSDTLMPLEEGEAYSLYANGVNGSGIGASSFSEFRSTGMPIRPIWSLNDQEFSCCPDDNHPHMIDLGLPNGTKWACCNVGASKPEDLGDYYAWGETEVKDCYTGSNYVHWDAENKCYTGISSEIGGTDNDVAYVKWNENWRMPSINHISELVENCTYEWTQLNGVNVGRFTGPNGNSIYLPTMGYIVGDTFYKKGGIGYYWSSTRHKTTNMYGQVYYSAFTLEFGLNQVRYAYDDFFHNNAYTAFSNGLPVRPVSE